MAVCVLRGERGVNEVSDSHAMLLWEMGNTVGGTGGQYAVQQATASSESLFICPEQHTRNTVSQWNMVLWVVDGLAELVSMKDNVIKCKILFQS